MPRGRMRSRTLALGAVFASLTAALISFPLAFATTPSGQINYFNVSGGACTSTAWTGGVGTDGNNPGFFPNNVGGPQPTAIVATGDVCIQVVLTAATPLTIYVITSNGLSGSLRVTTDGSGDGSNETVFTSSFSGQCTTVPLTMSPEAPYSLASGIGHVFVGTGTTADGLVTCTATGVPQFQGGALGLSVLMAVTIPAMLLLRRKTAVH